MIGTQPVRPLGERDHCQLALPITPSGSASDAVASTRAWTVPVALSSVTTPASSTLTTVIVTSRVASIASEALPAPSRPSWTETVTL